MVLETRHQEETLFATKTVSEGDFSIHYYLTRKYAEGRLVTGVKLIKEQNGELETAEASDIFSSEAKTLEFLDCLSNGLVTPMTLMVIVDDYHGHCRRLPWRNKLKLSHSKKDEKFFFDFLFFYGKIQ